MWIWLCVGCVGALLFGMCFGRISAQKNMPATAEGTRNLFDDRPVPYEKNNGYWRKEMPETVYSLGCPAAGEVTEVIAEGAPFVKIVPTEEYLWAPISGKIVKIGTLGNSFVIRTRYDADVILQVGEYTDDLLGRHFRSRVICNELVECGKLLVQYDLDSLRERDEKLQVTMTLRTGKETEVLHSVANGKRVKAGDEVLVLKQFEEEGERKTC